MKFQSKAHFIILAILCFFSESYSIAKSHYETLGVSETASEEEIKLAGRRLIRLYHPDHNNGDRSKESLLFETQQALNVLRDSKTRTLYDRSRLNHDQATYPYRGGVVSPNRGNHMTTMAHMRTYDWPKIDYTIPHIFTQSLYSFESLDLQEMTNKIKNQIAIGILRQMPTTREEFTIFDVSGQWATVIYEWANYNNYNAKDNPDMAIRIEAALRAIFIWTYEIRHLSESNFNNFIEYFNIEFAQKNKSNKYRTREYLEIIDRLEIFVNSLEADYFKPAKQKSLKAIGYQPSTLSSQISCRTIYSK